jgi:Flp pilus assembly protein TadB
MATHKTQSQDHKRNWRNEDEPWPIWAALMVFLNILVIATMVWGLPGLVLVTVFAAIGMVTLLIFIVFG